MSQRHSIAAKYASNPHVRPSTVTPLPLPSSAIPGDIESYIEENKRLKVKCSKIEEIEKYADILVVSIEKYKESQVLLEQQVAQLTKQNQHLRGEVAELDHQSTIHQQNRQKQREVASLKKQTQMAENMQLMRLEQELASERNQQNRSLQGLQIKHKHQLERMESQLRQMESIHESENHSLMARTDSIVKENAQLKTRLGEVENQLRVEGREKDLTLKENLQLQELINSVKMELKERSENYAMLERQSHEAIFGLKASAEHSAASLNQVIADLRLQGQRLRVELASLGEAHGLTESLNIQLRNEGAMILLECNEAKENRTALEQERAIHLRQIEGLSDELQVAKRNEAYQVTNYSQRETVSAKLIEELETELAAVKASQKELEIEVATKQKEIEDLIVITDKLEADLRAASSKAELFEKTNRDLIEEKQVQLGRQAGLGVEVKGLVSKVEQAERGLIQKEAALGQQGQKNIELQTRLNECTVSLREAEKQMAVDHANQRKLQLSYEEERKKRHELEAASESLRTSLREMASARAQKNISEEETATQLARVKARVAELEGEVTLQKQKRVQQLQQLEMTFTAEKSSLVKQGMQEIQSLVTQRYDQVLRQYKEHYISRIRELEAQVASIRFDDL